MSEQTPLPPEDTPADPSTRVDPADPAGAAQPPDPLDDHEVDEVRGTEDDAVAPGAPPAAGDDPSAPLTP